MPTFVMSDTADIPVVLFKRGRPYLLRAVVQCSAADDTELLPDNEVVAAEEALEKLEEDGIQLEPFNLAQVSQTCWLWMRFTAFHPTCGS